MAELPNSNPTYLDWSKRLNPGGKIDQIVELLSQDLPMLQDVTVLEANDVLSHRTTVRTGLPTGTWRRLNYGVPKEKSTTAQVTDSIGSLETYAEVDKDLVDLNGNSAAWRLSEESAFREGLAQTMGSTLIYGNTDTDPEKFMGLTERYNDTSAGNGRMVITGNNGGATTSIWGVVWSPASVHMTFPKGSMAGLKHEDLGQETLEDENGNYYEGYRSHYQWKAGFVVRDWRQAVRITNIDLASDNILDLMIEAYNQIHRPSGGRLCWYANRAVKTALDKEAKNGNIITNSTGYATTAGTPGGMGEPDGGGPKTMFWGSPIKLQENLLSTEANVS